jgi:hypothetical protein
MMEHQLRGSFTAGFRRLSTVALSLACVASLSVGSVTAAVPQPVEDDAFMPVVLNSKCYALKAKTPFAMAIYGGSGAETPNFKYMEETGATWYRNEVDWASVEPVNVAPSQYDWSAPDAIAGAARDGCYHLVFTHLRAPAWAATHTESEIDKVGLEEFQEYIGALVERYDGDGINDAPGSPVVNYFEFYNEPDAGNTVPRWGHIGDKYAEMLKVVYPVIKAANPNAQVVLGGIAYDFFEEDGGPFVRSFLDDVLDAGGGDYFDVMNFHQYPAFAERWAGRKRVPGLLEKTIAVRKKLTDRGLNKPIIITETGWHNNTIPGKPDLSGNDRVQSRYIVELFAQSIAADVQMTTYWTLFDLPPTYEYEIGLADIDGVRKPAFFVYQRAAQEMGNLQYVRTLPQSETGNRDLEAYEFRDLARGNQRLFVAWVNPVDSTQTLPLTITANEVTVRTMNGDLTTVRDNADGRTDGRVRISVTDPVYIRVIS